MALGQMGYQVRLYEFPGTLRHPHGDMFKRPTEGQPGAGRWKAERKSTGREGEMSRCKHLYQLFGSKAKGCGTPQTRHRCVLGRADLWVVETGGIRKKRS